MPATADDVGSLGFTFAIGAAIVAVRSGVAMATGMGAFLRLIHGLEIS
jgi:hypothetical protein